MPAMTTVTKNQYEVSPNALRQVYLLLAILKGFFFFFLPVLKEKVTLESVYERLEALKAQYAAPPDSSVSESRESESTCKLDARSEDPRLISAVRRLCRAIVQRDFKETSSMLELNPRLARKQHEGGWFPLHAAILTGDIELVRLLLDQPKVDVDSVYSPKSDDCFHCLHSESRNTMSAAVREYELGTRLEGIGGATPLHLACMVGNIEILRLLVDHGAFFGVKDHEQREPIEYFDAQQHPDAIAVYNKMYSEWKEHDKHFKRYNSVDGLAQLIRKDKYDEFERTLDRYPDLATRMTDDGSTLLHLAVIRRRRHFVRLLLSKDKDKKLVNKRDARCHYFSSLSSFAPPTIPHRHVRKATPLHYACLVQDMEIVEMLLEAGADWHLEDSEGRIPEELIHGPEDAYREAKSTFVRLKNEEKERRKEEEKNRSPGDDDDDKSPSKVSMKALLKLEKQIGEKLVGQRGPIRSLAQAIRLRESGWVDPERPLTMLFLGSSGVGKTELAKQLALYLHGKDGMATDTDQSITKLEKNHGFVRIDMSEFQERHTVFNLIGAPKSYVGYGDGGALTQPLKKNPKAVVLLDEIEKAHPDVLNTFLQVFDEGRITDSEDGVVYCKDAIFIMTSNIAGDEIKDAAPMLRHSVEQSEKEGRPEMYIQLIQSFTRSIRPQLKQHLKRDEFIGRINQIVVFLPLSQEEIETTVQRELEMWSKRAEEKHRIKLAWTDEVVRKLASFYDVNYGVRSVANEVQRIAMHLVADAHINGQLLDDWQAELTTNEVGDIVMAPSAKVPEDEYDFFFDFIWNFA